MPSSYAVGEHFEHFIRSQVDGGRYASASEVVRAALIGRTRKNQGANVAGVASVDSRRNQQRPGETSKTSFHRTSQSYRRNGANKPGEVKPVHFSPLAETDLVEIGIYIACDNPKRALSFIDELGVAERRHADGAVGLLH